MIEEKCAASLDLADPCIAPPLLIKQKANNLCHCIIARLKNVE
jgi:hypothetical protein